MRIHVHAAGGAGARTEEVAPEVALGEVVVLDVDERVYRVDDETELVMDVKVVELFGDGSGHVVVSACKKVAITGVYAGVEKTVSLHPSARLRRVRQCLIDEFKVPEGDAADLVLRLPGGEQDLDLAAPVTSIVPKGTCAVTVDLVHTVRPQG